jgi:signal transduction histidine kinase
MALSLNRVLVGVVGAAILAGLVPAAVVFERRLATALEDRARADLALAPRVLADRLTANATTMMMYAKDLAHASGLATAIASGNRASAIATLGGASAALGASPVLVGPDGATWEGPSIDTTLLAETRVGRMPVVTQRLGRSIRHIALAPIERDGRWIGAAGVTALLDERVAGTLSGLTRSEVALIADSAGPVASTLDSAMTRALADAVSTAAIDGTPRKLTAAGRQVIAVAAPLNGAGMAVFVRPLDEELAVLPQLRRVAALSAVAALLIAVALGVTLAARVTRPVHQLATAATAFTSGNLSAPVPASRIVEVQQVADAFDEMRRVLAARLADLAGANAALTDRNARLTALQADLMQRDRLAATGRLVAQLAHEIRNPVASLRNCLELIRRRVEHDAEAREFADLAIDELLRMHELAEQMLDHARPRDPNAMRSRPAVVAQDVARLTAITSASTSGRPSAVVHVTGDDGLEAAIAPDALKQVLLNLLQNARDASPADTPVQVAVAVGRKDGHTTVDVVDSGPGISPTIRHRVFDPFFTTKDAVHGVGLGLFVAEGLVRTAGGTITVQNGGEAMGLPYSGAWFHITLPVPNDQPSVTGSSAAVVSASVKLRG